MPDLDPKSPTVSQPSTSPRLLIKEEQQPRGRGAPVIGKPLNDPKSVVRPNDLPLRIHIYKAYLISPS